MKIAVKIFAVCATICSACTAIGETETVEGLTWTYTVTNGQATVGGGSSSSTAVEKATTGDIAIPSTLGGAPVTSVGDLAFYSCGRLTSVVLPLGVTNIGKKAFYYCSNLTNLVIPASVTSIGDNAFNSCWKLAGGVTIPSGVTRIGTYAFDGCSGLTSVILPDGMMSVGYGAFSGCSGLTSIVIPNSVTNIGDWAFKGCSGLESVTLSSNIAAVGDSTFRGCRSLTSIDMPTGVTSVGKLAFCDCSRLASVKMPNSVTNIGDNAFRGCGELTSVVIPNGVTSISTSTFYGCVGLREVSMHVDVMSIGDGAFSGCSGLTSMVMPIGVTSIGEGSFFECLGLTNIVFDGNAPTVGDGAFLDVASECTATVYEGTEGWDDDGDGKWDYGKGASMSLSWRKKPLTEGGPYQETVNGIEWTFTVDACLNARIAAIPTSTIGKITVPTELGGRPVTRIDAWAFQGRGNLEMVVVPSNVVEIGVGAFADCNSLTNITFLGTEPPKVPSAEPTVLDSYTEDNWSYDESYYKSRTCYWQLERSTIFGYQTTVNSYEQSKYSYEWNFYYDWDEPILYDWIKESGWDKSATKITVLYPWPMLGGSGTGTWQSADVEQVGWITQTYSGKLYVTAFHPSPNGALIVPETINCIPVYGIASSAFYGCSITNACLPEGLSVIDNWAFEATKLVSVTIPTTLTRIGYGAFYNCQNLERINIRSVSDWTKISFGNANANPLLGGAKLYVDDELVSREIVLDANGGNIALERYQAPVGIALGSIPTPTKSGFAFLGWFTGREGGVIVDKDTIVDSDMGLYAHWLEKASMPTVYAPEYFKSSTTIRITADEGARIYYTTDGTDPNTNSTVYTEMFTISDSVTIKAIAVKDGYAVSDCASRPCHKYEPSSSGGESFSLYSYGSESRSFYVNGSATVSFEMLVDSSSYGEGYVRYEISGPEYYSGELYYYSYSGNSQTFSQTLTQSGYYTITWSRNAYYGDRSVTIGSYAVRMSPTYWNVYFDSNGGTACDSKYYYRGDSYGTLPTPTREDGEDFLGWYDENGVKIIPSTTVDSQYDTIVLSARWQNVGKALDPNGIYGVVRDQKGTWLVCSYDANRVEWTAASSLPDGNSYDVLTYHVSGRASCSLDIQSLGGLRRSSVLVDKKEVTLYGRGFDIVEDGEHEITVCVIGNGGVPEIRIGQLSVAELPQSITVTLDANGGVLSTNKVTYVLGDNYGMLPQPSLRGCEFLGWYDMNDALVTPEALVPMVPNGLTAKWRVLPEFFSEDGKLQFEISSNFTWSTSGGYYAKYELTSGSLSDDNKELIRTTINGRGVLSTSYGNYCQVAIDGNVILPTTTEPLYLYEIVEQGSHTIVISRKSNYSGYFCLYPFSWTPVGDTLTLSLDPNGGELEQSTVECDVGSTYSDLPVPNHERGDFAGWYCNTSNWGDEKFWASNDVAVSLIYTNFTAAYVASGKTFDPKSNFSITLSDNNWAIEYGWNTGNVEGGCWTSKTYSRSDDDAYSEKRISVMKFRANKTGVLTIDHLRLSSSYDWYNYINVKAYVTDGPWLSLNNSSYDYSYSSDYYYCWQGSWSCQNGQRGIDGLKIFVVEGREYEISLTIGSDLFSSYYNYFYDIGFNLSVGEFSVDPWRYISFDAGGHGRFYNDEQSYTACMPELAYWKDYAPTVYPSNGWEFVKWTCEDDQWITRWPITAIYEPKVFDACQMFAGGTWTVSDDGYVKGHTVSTNWSESLPYIVLTSPNGTNEWVELTVTNDCKIAFDCKASTLRLNNKAINTFKCLTNGVEVLTMSGNTEWQHETLEVSAGTSVRWCYAQKATYGTDYENCGWLRNVEIYPRVVVSFASDSATTGEMPSDIYLYEDETVVLPNDEGFSLPCYTFVGWSGHGQIYAAESSYGGTNGTVELTAAWQANVLAAPSIGAQAVYAAKSQTVALTTEDEGAEIYYSTGGLPFVVYSEPFNVTGETVIRAYSTKDNYFNSPTSELAVARQSYQVTFEAGDCGSIVVGESSQSVRYGDDAVPVTVVADKWHNFVGWDGAYVNITSSRSLVAQYESKSFTLRFGDEDFDWTYGNALTGPVPTQPKYRLVGWTYQGTNYVAGSELPFDGENVQYTAVWEAVRLEAPTLIAPSVYEAMCCSVSATAQDGAVIRCQVGVGDWFVYDGPFEVSRESVIRAYATGEDYFDSATNEISVARQQYAVSFSAGAFGEIVGGDAVQQVRYGDDAVPVAIQADFWHVFDGWSGSHESITSARNLVAQYRPAVFRLNFDGEPLDWTYGDELTGLSPILEKHHFVGWSYLGTTYDAGSTLPFDGTNVNYVAVWEEKRMAAPVLCMPERYDGESCSVTATAQEGATIHCKIGDGAWFVYTGAFDVVGSATVTAYATADDYFDSECVVCTTIRGPWTFGEYLGASNVLFSTSGECLWQRTNSVDGVAGYYLTCGAMADQETGTLSAMFKGAGTLRFRFRASVESWPEVMDFDTFVFADNGSEIASWSGETGWQEVSFELGEGDHEVSWSYLKDDGDVFEANFDNRVWLDSVTWMPFGPSVTDDPDAIVTGDSESGYTIKPSEGMKSVEVTIPSGVSPDKVTVVLRVDVETVKPNGANVKIVKGGDDITSYLSIPTVDASGAIDLTKATVKSEIVKEALDPDKGAEIVLNAESPSLTTSETKLGLTYTLHEGATLQGMNPGDSKVGDGQPWTPSITIKGGTSGFYSIGVTK